MNYWHIDQYYNRDNLPEGCHRIISHGQAMHEETQAVWAEYYATASRSPERTEVNRRLRSLRKER